MVTCMANQHNCFNFVVVRELRALSCLHVFDRGLVCFGGWAGHIRGLFKSILGGFP